MKRTLVIAAALLAATPALAQAPAAPGGVLMAKNCKSCCSIFDMFGVKQAAGFLNEYVGKSALGQAVGNVFSPVARALGLGPSLVSDRMAKQGGAMALANKLKKEQKKKPLKLKAIQYLGTLDCNCEPEIVTELLKMLDDCDEDVRYEALRALKNKCHEKKHGHKQKCKDGQCTAEGDCPEGPCCGCQCQKRVIDRLHKLLLDRDSLGCLKETSPKVRALATQMIEECLVLHEPPPATEAPIEEKKGPDERPQPTPDRRPDARPDRIPQARTREASPKGGNWLQQYLAGNRAPRPNPASEARPAQNAGGLLNDPATTPYAPPKTLVGATGASEAATTPPAAAAERMAPPVTEPAAAEVPVPAAQAPAPEAPVTESAPARGRRSRAARPPGAPRHLWGEVFGY